MSDKEKTQNFSLVHDSLNKSYTRSLNSSNNGLPPKINPAKYTVSATNQVIANQTGSNTSESTQGSSGSD